MTRFLATLLASAALCTSLPLQARAELDAVSLKSAIERSVESDYPKLDALYKDIHAHPEIAFQEEKTAAKLAAEMRTLGFEVTEHVGKTGLVAIYKNSDGPTSPAPDVCHRADRVDRDQRCKPLGAPAR
jgi:metal-dependent amidase/aminoacylase/carboxypeptidase family protein